MNIKLVVGIAFGLVVVFAVILGSMTFDILSQNKKSTKEIYYMYVHRQNDKNYLQGVIR
jgi:hypothetical protein